MKNVQLRPGQDVLYVQSNNQVLPGKLIRETDGNRWNIFLFTDGGSQVLKEIQYNEQPTSNTFHLQEEAGHSRAAGASSR